MARAVCESAVAYESVDPLRDILVSERDDGGRDATLLAAACGGRAGRECRSVVLAFGLACGLLKSRLPDEGDTLRALNCEARTGRKTPLVAMAAWAICTSSTSSSSSSGSLSPLSRLSRSLSCISSSILCACLSVPVWCALLDDVELTLLLSASRPTEARRR